jgi:outer membrane protein assembly factor BamB
LRSGQRDYGYTCAPLLHGETLIVEVGDDEGTLMGFDKRTGRRRWAGEYCEPAGHAGGIVPMEVEGVACVAVLSLHHLLVTRVDAGNEGRTVGTFPWITEFGNSIATPAVEGQHVYITSRYNNESVCKLRVALNGVEKAWQQPFASGICSPVLHNGHIYWANQEMVCLDAKTGQKRWSGGRFGDAGSCVLTSDGRIIVWADRGTLALIETATRSPDKYTKLAELQTGLGADVWPHAALAGRRLFLKDRNGTLLCYGLTEP